MTHHEFTASDRGVERLLAAIGQAAGGEDLDKPLGTFGYTAFYLCRTRWYLAMAPNVKNCQEGKGYLQTTVPSLLHWPSRVTDCRVTLTRDGDGDLKTCCR